MLSTLKPRHSSDKATREAASYFYRHKSRTEYEWIKHYSFLDKDIVGGCVLKNFLRLSFGLLRLWSLVLRRGYLDSALYTSKDIDCGPTQSSPSLKMTGSSSTLRHENKQRLYKFTWATPADLDIQIQASYALSSSSQQHPETEVHLFSPFICSPKLSSFICSPIIDQPCQIPSLPTFSTATLSSECAFHLHDIVTNKEQTSGVDVQSWLEGISPERGTEDVNPRDQL